MFLKGDYDRTAKVTLLVFSGNISYMASKKQYLMYCRFRWLRKITLRTTLNSVVFQEKKNLGKKLTVKFNFVSCIHDFTIEQEKITFFRQLQ